MLNNDIPNSSFPTRPTTILDSNLQAMSKTVHFAPCPTIMDSPESVTTDDDDSSSQADIPYSPVISPRRTKEEFDDFIERLFGSDTTHEKIKETHEQENESNNQYINKSKRKRNDKDTKVQDKESKKRSILTRKSTSIQPALKQVQHVSFSNQRPKKVAMWNGYVELPGRIKFQATARQIGGRRLNKSDWNSVLSPTLWMEGRVHVDAVVDYVNEVQYATATRHEIVLALFEPTNDNENQANTLKEYLESRQRWGVISHDKAHVKDFYMMPLGAFQQLPDFLYVVHMDEEQIKHQGNVFIGIIVIQKPSSSLRRSSNQE
ncbi:hypothetical protein K492DRAFT_238059 [Lichtheimia hyalospora FSU 10163]|nr:hypothetical protein K492DRAFT_238059 [Lichtheimia hyalospora FSU 10163]